MGTWLLVSLLAAEPSAPARTLWGPPGQLRSLSWSSDAAQAEAQDWALHDPSDELTLAPGRLLLVPVRLGQLVEVSAEDFQTAFVYGSLEEPDAVLWRTPAVGREVLRVPTWGYPRFVGIRVTQEHRVRVRVAVPVRDQLAFHRLDAEMQRVLRTRGVSAPSLPDGDGQDLLDALLVQRDIVFQALEGVHRSRRDELERAAVYWLASSWLSESYTIRPLLRPYFLEDDLSVEGGVTSETDDEGTEWYEVPAGEALSFGTEADVLRLAISAWAGEDAHYQILQGEELESEQVRVIPERSMLQDRWTPPRSTRVVLRGGADARLVVRNGRVKVSATAVAAQVGLFEAAQARSPARLLDAALQEIGDGTEVEAQLLRLLVLDERLGSEASGDRLWRLLEREKRPGVRALVYSALLPRFNDQQAVAEQIADFWKATLSVSFEQATILRHWVLGRIHAARDVPPVDPSSYESLRELLMAGSGEMDAPVALTHRALVQLLLPPRDGLRPTTAAALEERAATAPHRADYRRLARSFWRRVSPWTTLDLTEPGPGELHWQVPRPEVGEELCELEGSVGLRWTQLNSDIQRFDVAPAVGTHVSVPLLPLPNDSAALPADSKVAISDTEASVLSVAGRTSRVLLAAGTYDFFVPRGPPVVARIPRTGQAPCDSLYEARRWHEVDGKITLPLPAGDTPTVASIVVDPESLPTGGAELSLRAGAIEHLADIRRPATGAVEIAVAPGETQLELQSTHRLLVRVRIRQHRQGGPGIPEDKPEARDTKPRLVKLERLRLLARESRKLETMEALSRLRTRRARLLQQLGYGRLASVDASRRVPAAPAISHVDLPPGEVWLPHRDDKVIVATRPARLPLMPTDLAQSQLVTVQSQLLRRQDVAALHTLDRAGAQHTRGRGAQTLAILLEEQGDVARSAALYEAMSEVVPAAEHFAAAAEMRTAQAIAQGDLGLTERAHYLARQAAALGAREVTLLAPFSDSVRWQAPSLSSLGKGVVRLDVRGDNPRAHSEANQLRAALIDKPEQSRWLSERSALSLRPLRGKQLRVNTLCFLQQGPVEACQARLEVDGEELSCTKSQREPMHLATRPQSCEFVVSGKAQRLRLLLPRAGDPVGWYSVEELGIAGPSVVPERHSFARISPDSPMEIQVMAPTVVRLRARALGEAEATLDAISTASVFGSEPPDEVLGAAQRWHLTFHDEIDPHVELPEATEGVQYEVSQYLVVEGKGLRTLIVTPSREGVLVKPELPLIVQPPSRPKDESEEVSAAVEKPSPWTGFDFPPPGERPDEFPLTLSGDLSVVDRDLAESDVDARDRYAQLMISLRQQLLERGLWASVGLFNRLRDGPGSFGLDLMTSLSASGYAPGGYARVRVTTQPLRGGLAMGARGTLGVYESLPMSPRWTLLPGAALTLRHSDPVMLGERGADRDVASTYADTHPVSLDLLATFANRPYYDTRGRYGAAVRLNPDLAAVDRAELTARVDWVGGAGYSPWIQWECSFGYRPQNDLRTDPFFRVWTAPSATVWRWLVGGGRLRAALSLGSYIDIPLRERPLSFFGALGVGYDYIGARGLRDYRPLERIHRARLEEGSRRVNTAPAPSDAYWKSDDESDSEDPEEAP